MQKFEYKEGERLTIEIGEHTYTTPPMPSKKEILFGDKKPKDQYWVRQTDFPKWFYYEIDGVEEDADVTYERDGKLVSLSKSDTALLIKLRDRELGRMTNGIWFFNNGEPTYITGGHYFALQWGKMRDCKNYVEPGSNYGQYYRFQRKYLYAIKIAETTPHGNGIIVIKSKKTGLSQLSVLDMLCDSILMEQQTFSMMSVTDKYCKDLNFRMASFAIQSLPPILRPSHTKINEGEVFWGAPPNEIKSRTKKTEQKYLNTCFNVVPTKRNGFDGITRKKALIDEVTKIIANTSPDELLTTTLPTVLDSRTRVGTIIALAYVGEKNDKAFRECREWSRNSSLKTVNPKTNKTKSQLIYYFISALEGLRDACDIYGNPIVDKIYESIEAEIEQYKNDERGLQAKRRQFPITNEDAWDEGALGFKLFDNFRLGRRLSELETQLSLGMPEYRSFNFKWSRDPVIDHVNLNYIFPSPRVQWVTNAEIRSGYGEGLFKWYDPDWTPADYLSKYVNKEIYDKWGRRIPQKNSPFAISVDSTSYANKADVKKQSKNALQVFIMPDVELNATIGANVTNCRLMVEYLHRSDKVVDFLHSAIQAVLYFNCPILIENNQAWLATHFEDYGLGQFLLRVNTETGQLVQYEKRATNQKPFSIQRNANSATVDTIVRCGKVHTDKSDVDTDPDNVLHINSISVCDQLIRFDPNDTTEFDAAMCYLEGLYTCFSLIGTRQLLLKKQTRNGNKVTGILVNGLR